MTTTNAALLYGIVVFVAGACFGVFWAVHGHPWAGAAMAAMGGFSLGHSLSGWEWRRDLARHLGRRR